MTERTGGISPTTWRRMLTIELICWLVLTVGFLSAVPAAYQAVSEGPVEETSQRIDRWEMGQ